MSRRRGPGFGLLAAMGAACAAALALEPVNDIRQYSLAVWKTEEGLPGDAIQAIVQSPDGRLWLGTHGGLVRFDGMQFTVYDSRNTPQLRHNSVTALCLLRSGALWVGTANGIAVYQDGRFTAHHSVESGLPNGNIRSIYESRDGSIWISAHGGGLVRYSGGRFSAYTTRDGLPSNSLRLVYEDSGGTLWVATNEDGLCSFRSGRFRCFGPADGLATKEIRAVHEDRDGRLWAGARADGLLQFDGQRFRAIPAPAGKRRLGVRAIVEDRHNNLWIATEGDGLYRLRDGIYLPVSTREGLPHNFVRSLLEDREGNLWLGTQGGLARIRDNAALTWTTADGLVNDNVRTVFEDQQGRVWVGTENSASVIEKGIARTVRLSADWTRDAVRAIAQGRNGTVWLGAETGLFAWRDGTVKATAAGLTRVCALAEDRRGRLWIGSEQGLSVLEGGGLRGYSQAAGLASAAINAIAEDRSGRLWIGTSAGLVRFDGNRFERFTAKDGLPADHVNSLHIDPANTVWAGTRGGVARRLDNGRFAAFTKREGLASNNVLQVVADRLGYLWLSSRSEVSRIAMADFEALAAGRARDLRPVVYGASDGMKSARCNGDAQPAGATTSDGRVWFPTLQGVVVFDPARLPARPEPPRVLPLVVESGSKSYPVAPGGVELPAGTADFAVQFSAISLGAPERVRFRYRLDGLDREWRETAQRRTGWYAGLSPGRYRFRAAAYSGDGTQSGPEAAFDIELTPRFHQTAWFYGLCAAGLAGLGTLAYRIKVAGICRRYEAVLEERTRIGREIHDTLMQGVTGISLQLEAARRQLPGSPDEATGRIDRALNRLDEVLAEARRCILELRTPAPPGQELAAPLRQMAEELGSARGIRTRVEVEGHPEPLPARVSLNLLRIAREAVTNSVLHSRASNLRVHVRFQSGDVSLSAADDGCGFDAAQVGAAHFGLLGMRERALEIGGTLEIHSALGSGTEILVTVPAGSRTGSPS